jgi:hypothetical protein
MATMSLASVAFVGALVVQSVSGKFTTGYGSVSRWLADGNDGSFELMDFGALVPAFRDRGLLDRPGVFVFADRWFIGGKVDYAFKGRLPFLLFDSSDPRQYAFFDSSDRYIGAEGILVTQRDSVQAVRRDFDHYCSSIDSLGSVPIRRSGRVEWTLHLYRCAELLHPYPVPYH